MGKSQETFSKKENEKKRIKKRQDKMEKKQERQANSNKGKSLEDMMAYIDENGNLSATPVDPRKKRIVNSEDMQISIPRQSEMDAIDPVRKGVVTFFNESKGFGFIKDTETQESVFVHVNGLLNAIKENDKVSFQVVMGHKGKNAVEVSKI